VGAAYSQYGAAQGSPPPSAPDGEWRVYVCARRGYYVAEE